MKSISGINKKVLLISGILLFIGISTVVLYENCRNNQVEDRGEWIPISLCRDESGICSSGTYALYDNHIYCVRLDESCFESGWSYTDFEPMYGVDIKSFEIEKNSSYAKDSKRVYYPVSLRLADGLNFGYSYSEWYTITAADAESFRYLGEEYAVDKNNMYYEGRIVPYDTEIIKRLIKR